MAINILVPELGGATSKAKVTHWHKNVGDYINAGEVLLELESQKVIFEVNAESAGILTQINVLVGANAKIGDTLGVIDETAAQPSAS